MMVAGIAAHIAKQMRHTKGRGLGKGSLSRARGTGLRSGGTNTDLFDLSYWWIQLASERHAIPDQHRAQATRTIQK